MMYPLFLIGELAAIWAGTHTEKIKFKAAATAVLIMLGIITIWYTLSHLLS